MITYESLAAEAVQRYNADPARAAKAIEIVTEGRISLAPERLPTGQYNVRNSNGYGWYCVNPLTHTCTCMDSQQSHVCKHRLAVWMRNQYIERNGAAAYNQSQATYRQRANRTTRQAQILAELGYT